jgi:CheY-like chemotaxis protein
MAALLRLYRKVYMLQIYAIIDDDQDDIDVLCEAVAAIRPSFECLTFINPVAALESLEKSWIVPAFIFVDYNMPIVNGMAVVSQIRQDDRFKESIVTVISTGIGEKDAKAFTELGADYVYKKPYTIKDYINIVQEVMRD